MTPSTPLQPNNFDLIRLLAALQVAVFHCAEHLRAGIDHSHPLVWALEALPGVPIFFVVSGFLISASFERNHVLAQFTRNRCLRIFPGLWLCLAMSMLLAATIGRVDFLRWETIPWLAAQITVGQFYNPDFLRGYGVGVLNGALWSIPVELQFYAVLPILYVVFGWFDRHRNAGLLGVTLAGVVLNQIYVLARTSGGDDLLVKLAGVSLAPYLYMFLTGTIIQRFFHLLLPLLERKALVWLASYLAVTLACERMGVPSSPNNPSPLAFPFLAMCVISAAYSARSVAASLLRGQDISYGVYIYHMPIANALVALGSEGRWWHVATAIAMAGLCATLSWFTVERRALAHKRNPLHEMSGAGRSSGSEAETARGQRGG